MSWARYDDELSMNKKVGRLRAKGVDGIAAVGLHLLANTYCRHNGTAGEIEAHVPELLAGRCGKRLAGLLAEVGMFDVTENGWSIHDFEEFHDPTDPDPNRSAADRKRELSEKRAAAGRNGGLAKAGKVPSKPLANDLANPGNATATGVAKAWQTPSPVPVPVPIEKISLHTKSVTPDPAGGESSSSRRDQVIADYHRIERARMEAAGETIKSVAGLKHYHTEQATTNPNLEHWLALFPTAPPDAIAAWLLGDKGSMRYYPRSDELEADEDGPESADVIPFNRKDSA